MNARGRRAASPGTGAGGTATDRTAATSSASSAPVRVVGVDPGLANIGLGAIEEVRPGARLLGSELITTSPRASQPERLLRVRAAFHDFVKTHRPDAIAIEGQYFHRQRDVAFRVGQAVGVVLLTAAEAGVPVFEYGPMQVKRALVGTGKADKAQVAYMVRALLTLPSTPTSNHVADALALALTHLQSRRIGQLTSD